MNRGHPVGSWVGAVPADSTHTRRERDEGGVLTDPPLTAPSAPR